MVKIKNNLCWLEQKLIKKLGGHKNKVKVSNRFVTSDKLKRNKSLAKLDSELFI